MIVSSIPLQTKPRCVWEDTAITPIIRTSYNWITWWLEVRKQYIKTLVKAVCCSVSSTFYDMNLLKLFHGELFFSNWCYFFVVSIFGDCRFGWLSWKTGTYAFLFLESPVLLHLTAMHLIYILKRFQLVNWTKFV